MNDEDFSDELAEERQMNRYYQALAYHPDINDPDHPDPKDYGIKDE